jgi:hypothetical protein
MSKPFVSRRDARFEYSAEAVEFIERTNCAKGCAVERVGVTPHEPGGSCELIVAVVVGDGVPIPDLTDGGTWIRCERRIPLDPEPVEAGDPPQADALFEVGR